VYALTIVHTPIANSATVSRALPVILVLLGILLEARLAAAADEPTRCAAAKLTAQAGFLRCRIVADAAFVRTGDAASLSTATTTCKRKLKKAFKKAERLNAGCPTTGDTGAVERLLSGAAATLGDQLQTSSAVLSTGQTTCWDPDDTDPPIAEIACSGTGQDGDLRFGAPLLYVDNGDGTITDTNTRLMWEKLSDDGSIHDKDRVYLWRNAFATKIVSLNSPTCFAGHCDWRLPNRRELDSILNFNGDDVLVASAFNSNCGDDSSGNLGCTVLTCSCTQSVYFLSSTTWFLSPTHAHVIEFSLGTIQNGSKSGGGAVRAVRDAD